MRITRIGAPRVNPARLVPPRPAARSAPVALKSEGGLLDPTHTDYQIKRRWFWRGYDVYAGGERIGRIKQRWLSLTPSYDLYDAGGRKVGTVSKRLIALGYDAKVKDGNGRTVGTIEQSFGRSLINPTLAFNVYDATGRRVALTDPAWLTFTDRIDLKDGRGEKIGQMRNSFSLFRESYRLTVSNDLDRRLALGLMAMQLNLKAELREAQEAAERAKREAERAAGSEPA